MKWWHIGLSARGRQTLFAEEAERRQAVRLLARAAPDSTLLYGVLDDHVHDIVAGDRPHAGKVARRLTLSLAPLARCRFQPAYIEPVNGRRHLTGLVRYLLTQPRKHELMAHSGLYTGSCFQDLVGARWVPGFRLQLAKHLPRLRLRTVLEMVGLPALPIEPLPTPQLRRLGLGALAEAASAALLTTPGLADRTRGALLARRAVAHLARALGFAPRQLQHTFGWSARTSRRYGGDLVPADALRAIGVRLALEQLVARAVNDRLRAVASEAELTTTSR